MKNHIIFTLLLSILLLFIFSGCGALITVIAQAILGTKIGFIAIPLISAADIKGMQVEENPGMILWATQNFPPGYGPASGATLNIDGIPVKTDESGFFTFSDLPVGLKTLKITFPGFIPIEHTVVVSEEGSEDRPFTRFNIVPEGPVYLALLSEGTVPGQANFYLETWGLDPDGNPISPVSTWSVNPSDAVVTLDGNVITFRTTKMGKYTITAISKIAPSRSDTVEIIVVDRTMKVFGKVTDKSGKPFPGATVSVKETNLFTVTDENGNYELSVPVTDVITVIAEIQTLSSSKTVPVTDPLKPVQVDMVLQGFTPGSGQMP